jgi:hypothetical protein
VKQKRLRSTLLVCVGVFACGGPAIGQAPGAGSEASEVQATANLGGTTVFGGVRLWINQWDIPSLQRVLIPNPANPTSVLLQDVLLKDLSKTELVPVPFIGVRAGNFVGSVSYFPRTGYDSRDPLLGTVDRDEFDVTLGYAVAPSLVLSLGYKHAFDNKLSPLVSPSGAKVDGILIGASGAAPLVGRLSLYGNVAYGFAREKADFSDSAGESKFSANYQIGEVGVSYLLYEGTEGRPLKNVLFSFGYRAQGFTVKSVALGTFGLGSPPVLVATQKKDIRTTTDGFVLGIVGSF